MSRRVMSLVVSILGLGAACDLGEQQIKDFCVAGEPGCPPCATADDCVFLSNACHATGGCAPKAAMVSVNQIGCEVGYEVPPTTCACVERSCKAVRQR